MDLIDQILNQAKDLLYCPVCKNHYNLGEIKFRGFIDNTYIFQAYCNKGHEPLAITYLASLHRLEKPIGAYFFPLTGKKITKSDFEKAKQLFDNFNGDFISAFK